MPSSRQYRVIQWATGNIGLRALQAELAHPQLEVVGVRVFDPAKVGQDVGTIAGTEPVGVLATDDVDALCLVPGVGKKTAARLLVELKSRLEVPELDLGAETATGPAPRAEVRAALTGLGYGTDEVRDVVAQLPEDGTVEDLLREALKLLSVHA